MSRRGTGYLDYMRSFLTLLFVCLVAAGSVFGSAPEDEFVPIPDEEVPYGVASSWLLGQQLLSEGNASEALPFLHQAYRAQPDVPRLALDFQEALAAEGYFQDALNVMDKLVTAWPDSLSYRMQRASLYLKIGKPSEAMDDLRAVREGGTISADLVMTEAALLASDGQHEQALDVCREGIASLPESGVRLYLGMASIEEERGRTDRIPDLMAEAVETYPYGVELWRIRTLALAEQGKHEEAMAVAREGDLVFANRTVPAEEDLPPTMMGWLPPIVSHRSGRLLCPAGEAGESHLHPAAPVRGG